MNPIDEIVWLNTSEIVPNGYNPNVVATTEMRLLEFSLITNGWVQPIIINDNEQGKVIIDGFHRFTLANTSKALIKRDGGKVPCVLMNLSEPERMLLTIRINRAKGTHVSFRMADIVKQLIHEYNINPKHIAKSIGATKAEIDLLLMDDVFEKLDIPNHEYSKAWYPNYDK